MRGLERRDWSPPTQQSRIDECIVERGTGIRVQEYAWHTDMLKVQAPTTPIQEYALGINPDDSRRENNADAQQSVAN